MGGRADPRWSAPEVPRHLAIYHRRPITGGGRLGPVADAPSEAAPNAIVVLSRGQAGPGLGQVDLRGRRVLVTVHRLAEATALTQRRILVVEDNPVNQKVAAIMLQKIGCRVKLADLRPIVHRWAERQFGSDGGPS